MGIGARLAAVSLSCALWGAAIAAEAPPEVRALAAAQAKIRSLGGDFKWFTGTVDGTGEVRERRGDFAVVRGVGGAPAMYNVKTTDLTGADVHRWCSDGVDRWEIEQVVPDDEPTRRRLRPGAQDLDLDRVVACVLLDLPVLERDFRIAVEAVGSRRRLVFTPAGEDLRAELTAIVVTLDGDDPTEVVIDDPKNTRIRLELTHLAQDKDWPEVFFRPVPKSSAP